MKNENRKKLNHFQVRVFMKLRKHKHARERKEEGKPDKRTGTVLKTVGALTGLGSMTTCLLPVWRVNRTGYDTDC